MKKTVGIIGDFDFTKISHIKTNQCFTEFEKNFGYTIDKEWLSSADIQSSNRASLDKFCAFWGAPGGYESEQGALYAMQYAREKRLPYLGT